MNDDIIVEGLKSASGMVTPIGIVNSAGERAGLTQDPVAETSKKAFSKLPTRILQEARASERINNGGFTDKGRNASLRR